MEPLPVQFALHAQRRWLVRKAAWPRSCAAAPMGRTHVCGRLLTVGEPARISPPRTGERRTATRSASLLRQPCDGCKGPCGDESRCADNVTNMSALTRAIMKLTRLVRV